MTTEPAAADDDGRPGVELRDPAQVMTLPRMGSSFPTRLSFMRSLLRELAQQGSEVERTRWEIDDQGFGRAVYSLDFHGHRYSLVAFSAPLADEDRTDRVIATAWDSSYVLFDGLPSAADLDRLAATAPRQEAARFDATVLILSRANRSVRLFDHVVDRLAAGQQPDRNLVRSVGYLMRTTAVYGNGKFGIADRGRYRDRPAMDHPFRAELLTVWLIRAFTIDLVEHIAARRAPASAVALDPELRRYLGIGNATGLGMAPFLVSHPILINNWFLVRETALARVRALPSAEPTTAERFLQLAERVSAHLADWSVQDELQMDRIEQLRQDWASLLERLGPGWPSLHRPWDRLVRHSSNYGLECQELAVAAVLEPHGPLVDGLACCMSSPTEAMIDPAADLDSLLAAIVGHWRWALEIDFDDPGQTARFWYVSEDNLEPRIGLRHEEDGAELEEPLDVARRVKALHGDVVDHHDRGTTVARFLLAHPTHRYAVRRVQALTAHPYGEIRGNLIGQDCRPIDLLRAKLAFFGASRFDPKSDRWTRVTLYQGAPSPEDLASGFDPDDWWLSVLAP